MRNPFFNRSSRTFSVILTPLSLMLLLLSSTTLAGQSRHFSIEELKPGVYAAIHNNDGGYAICNAGIIDLGDRTLIFDPFISPEAARDLRSTAVALTGREATLVVNSHFHNDHVRGNQVFHPGAEIVATAKARFIMDTIFAGDVAYEKDIVDQRIATFTARHEAATGPEKEELKMWIGYYMALKESHAELRNVLPTMAIESDLVIHGPARDVILKVMDGGHTPGDLVLWLPSDRVLFSGDQVFDDCHPWLADGDPELLIQDLDTQIDLDPEIVVPGHGPVGNADIVVQMRKYVEDLTEMAADAVRNGKTEEELVATDIPDIYQDWWYGRFVEWNLRFLYRRVGGVPSSE